MTFKKKLPHAIKNKWVVGVSINNLQPTPVYN